MKTGKFYVVLMMFVFIATALTTNAQTRQKELVMTVDKMYNPLLDRYMSGSMSMHFTYRLDKSGKIDRMHLNLVGGYLYDSNTGEEIRCLDTFNDNWGYYFWFMNNPNAANGVDCYNVKDGWLDEYMPEDYPFSEGTMIEMNWKFFVGGEVFGISTLIQLHRNAQGELVVDHSKMVVR